MEKEIVNVLVKYDVESYVNRVVGVFSNFNDAFNVMKKDYEAKIQELISDGYDEIDLQCIIDDKSADVAYENGMANWKIETLEIQ